MARIFISSTVFDLRDLRSALHYNLTALGHEVLLSEFSSFNPLKGLGSYEACLEKIDSCDLFVLLIASRVGGLVSAEPQISITRAEYQRAYLRVKAGRLDIISFARKEILDVIEDRKELAKLIGREKGEDASKIIMNAESKIMRDAEHIQNFVDEVARKHEMRQSVGKKGLPPAANWINSFTSFDDVIAPVLNRLHSGKNLNEVFIIDNLRREVGNNIQSMLMKSIRSETITPVTFLSDRLIIDCRLDTKNQQTVVKTRHLKSFLMAMISAPQSLSNCRIEWLDRLKESIGFYNWDEKFNSYIPDKIVIFCERLLSHYETARKQLNSFNSTKFISDYHLYIQINEASNNEFLNINNVDFGIPMSILSSLSRFFNGSVELYQHLSGVKTTLDLTVVEPVVVYFDQRELLEKEQVSQAGFDEFIHGYRPYLATYIDKANSQI